MNKQLNNIFVPVDVAELAKEKGFNEWCACLYNKDYGHIANSGYGSEWDLETNQPQTLWTKIWIEIPTHFQLIKWLKDTHDIDVQMEENGLFFIINQYGNRCYNDNDENHLEINEALTIALSQIP